MGMQGTIYIVDDDEEVRTALSLLFRVLGYSAETYASGREFLADARLDHGCILLDLHMPGASGIQVQEELQRRGIDLPVIALSGHGDIALTLRSLRLGAVEFLEKPYPEQVLLDAVQQALAAPNAVQERDRLKKRAETRLASLSEPQRLVLRGLLAGLTNSEIGRRLQFSPHTVAMHRATLLVSLEVHSLPGAIRLAIDGDLPPLEAEEEDTEAA